MKKRVCVLSLALPIETDPRTGRQVEALIPLYDVTVIGFGAPVWDSVAWRPVDLHTSRFRRLFEMLFLLLGRLLPIFYEIYFWNRPRYKQALKYALDAKADVYHASDWAVVPIAARAAKANGAQVVFDIDEYWPLFEESSRLWLLFFAPFTHYILKRYSRFVDRSITVSPPFVKRYKDEYGLDCIIAYNAPEYQDIPDHPVDPQNIRLIHHGSAQEDRKLETLVQAIAFTDQRYTLHFLLGGNNPGYVDRLKALAKEIAPQRVIFRDPVKYTDVVSTIADCDIELAFMAPTTYTWLMTLPNKVFEAMVAGLGVFVCPSPAMAEIVTTYNAGWVAPSFEPQDIANTLNSLTFEDIAAKRKNARAAAKHINAETERVKLITLYREVCPNHD